MKQVLLLLATLLTPGMTPTSPPPLPQGCSGCLGAAGGGSSSGGGCGGTLQINVTVTNGKCKWAATDSAFLYQCRSVLGCKTSVTRSWDNLPPGTGLEFCIDTGQVYCLNDPPTVGPTGSGSDTRDSITMPCRQGATNWTVSAGCGLSATAIGTCSACEGNI